MPRGPIERALLSRFYVDHKDSALQIARRLNCSEHKVNYWLLKHNIPKRSISEAIYAKHNPKGDPFQIREPRNFNEAKLFGLGLGLFWGEGNKRSKNSVRLGNADPAIIRNFLRFLLELFGVDKDKLRFGLQIFSDMSKEKVLNFWLKELKPFSIQRNQFFKVTVTPARSIGTYREKSRFGVLTVHFGNSKLKRIIDGMLPT